MYGSNVYKNYYASFDEFMSLVCIYWGYVFNICHYFLMEEMPLVMKPLYFTHQV